MFVYRHRQLADDLAAQARARRSPSPGAPLTIAVTGSGGLIGTALTALLTTSGHRVIRLVRRLPRHAGERYWRPEDPGPELLSGVDAVIHLAGASIGGRFTPDRKREIRDSRILPTRRLAELAAGSAASSGAASGPAGVRHRVGDRHLRPGPGRRGPDRGQRPRRGLPGRRGGRLGGRHRPGRRGGHPDGPGPHRHRADAARRHAAPAQPAVRGGPRRPARPRQAVAGLDRPGRPARHLPAGGARSRTCPGRSTRSPRSRCATSTTPGRWPACCTGPPLLPVPGSGPRLLLGAEGAREIAQASQYVRPERLIEAGHQFRQPELERRAAAPVRPR